jgi:mono/diheme cytochrome c family protein
MRKVLVVVFIAVGIVLGLTLTRPGPQAQGMRQTSAAVPSPPFDLKDPQAIGEGARLFQANCTGYCHGKEGRVSRAPKLRGREFDTEFLYQRIATGAPPMPAFQTIIPSADIWKLVAYVLSLKDAKDD